MFQICWMLHQTKCHITQPTVTLFTAVLCAVSAQMVGPEEVQVHGSRLPPSSSFHHWLPVRLYVLRTPQLLILTLLFLWCRYSWKSCSFWTKTCSCVRRDAIWLSLEHWLSNVHFQTSCSLRGSTPTLRSRGRASIPQEVQGWCSLCQDVILADQMPLNPGWGVQGVVHQELLEEQEGRWMRRPRRIKTSSILSERDRSLCL